MRRRGAAAQASYENKRSTVASGAALVSRGSDAQRPGGRCVALSGQRGCPPCAELVLTECGELTWDGHLIRKAASLTGLYSLSHKGKTRGVSMQNKNLHSVTKCIGDRDVRRETMSASLARIVGVVLVTAALAFAGSVSAKVGHWIGTWTSNAVESDAPFENETLRQIVYVSIGGEQVRVRLSNLFGTAPLVIDAASIGLHAGGSEVKPGTLRELTFGGEAAVTIAVGARVLSDAVDLAVDDASSLAVSLYVAGNSGPATKHTQAHQTNYIADGNQVMEPDMPGSTTTTSWFWLTGVEVLAHPNTGAVVTSGDSITEGYNSTLDANARYPDELARRLLARNPGKPRLAVLNSGISGNRLLTDIFGPNGQSRFDRDVLTQSGVTHVILLEGINDLGLGGSLFPPPVSAEQIIAGYKQVIARAHASDLKILIGTITPCKGFEAFLPGYWSPEVEAERQAVNEWIRTTDLHDGFVDFDAALRDPDDPQSLLEEYDSGDFLHPNDTGYAVMAAEAERALIAPAKGLGPRR